MSSTGRGSERVPLDYYRTPAFAVDAILPHLCARRAWLDPGCGDGAIAERVIHRWPGSRGIGVEIDARRAQEARRLPFTVYQGDFLAPYPLWEQPIDLVIGNPPYSLATEFIRRALDVVQPWGGEVAFLLRMGYLEAKRDSERDEFLEEHRPDVYVLARRPRFTADGGGDSATYAWMVFGPGRGERFTRLRAPEAP